MKLQRPFHSKSSPSENDLKYVALRLLHCQLYIVNFQFFNMDALYSLGVILVTSLKHLEKY